MYVVSYFDFGIKFANKTESTLICLSKLGVKKRCKRWDIRGKSNARLTSIFDRQSDAIVVVRYIRRDLKNNNK